MGRAKNVRKIQKRIHKTDIRLKQNARSLIEAEQPKKKSLRENINDETGVMHFEEIPASLFFQANMQLGPPYQILLDTNFINFSIQNKIDLFKGLLDCLMAKCIPTITDCIIGEIEKMGHKFKLALKIIKDPRINILTCTHKGTYADDCIIDRVKHHRCYVVGTNDKDLKNRIRKIPGVPIVFVTKGKYMLERLPDFAL